MFMIIVISLLSGAALTLLVLLYVVVMLFGYQGKSRSHSQQLPYQEQFSESKLLHQTCNQDIKSGNEVANIALNSLLEFYFQEMKNSASLRGWVRKKIMAEFNEIMKHRALRAVIKELTLRSFDLGSSLPSFQVVNVEKMHTKANTLETVDAIVDVEYRGNFVIVIEVPLSIISTASVLLTCRLNRVSGRARLRFSRLPYTSWSFAFVKEPVVVVDIKTLVDGRNVPQLLVPLLKKQIKRSIRRAHTLPNHKVRIGPFFRGCVEESSEVSAASDPRMSAMLVTVVSCSRLICPKESNFLYCLLQLDQTPYKPELQYEKKLLTLKLAELQSKELGVTINQMHHQLSHCDAPVVVLVNKDSVGQIAGLLKGDVIKQVDGEVVMTKDEVLKLIEAKRSRPCITMQVARYSLKVAVQSKRKSEAHNLANSNQTPSLDKDMGSQVTMSTSLPARLSTLPFTRNRNSRDSKMTKEEFRPIIDLSLTSSITNEKIIQSSHKKTTMVKSSTNPSFNERFLLELNENHIYLNVCLFSDNKFSNDSLVGYTSYSLHDAVAQCSATLQGDTMMTMPLKSPPDLNFLPSSANAKNIDPSRCYGDITVRFAKCEDTHFITPNESGTVVSNAHDGFVDIDVPSENLLNDEISNHDFQLMQFQRAVSCHSCSKKIWMKKALRCSSCGMICHNKCVAQCQAITKCDGEDFAWATQPSDNSISLKSTILSKLRRNRGNSENTANSSTASTEQGHQPQLSEGRDLTETSESSDDDFDWSRYIKKNPLDVNDISDEQAVSNAKQTGRDLYAGMDITERKEKLKAMVDKLHQEIDMISAARKELAASYKIPSTPAHKKVLQSQLNKSDEKLQSLAVMLIHYHSGLDNCVDLESGVANPEVSEVDMDGDDEEYVDVE